MKTPLDLGGYHRPVVLAVPIQVKMNLAEGMGASFGLYAEVPPRSDAEAPYHPYVFAYTPAKAGCKEEHAEGR